METSEMDRTKDYFRYMIEEQKDFRETIGQMRAKQWHRNARQRKAATNKLFMKTLGRFVLGSILFLGGPEFLLHQYVKEHPETLMQHYEKDNDGVYTFTPVPGCRLPPSQPFGLQFALNAMKITGLTLAFGGLPEDLHERRDDPVPLWKRVLAAALTLYQYVMVPVTMLSTILHFLGVFHGFQSYWAAYECFGVLWTLGPWWFNLMLLLLKFCLNIGTVAAQGVFMGDKLHGCQPKDALNMVLLKKTELEEFEMAKAGSYLVGSVFTVIPYFIVWLPYVITHVLPATIVFIPEVLLIVGLLGAVFFVVLRDGEGLLGNCALSEGGDPGSFAQQQQQMDAAVLAERTGGLMFLPGLLIFSVLAEVLLLQAVYLYAGDGWFGSMTEVWTERQTKMYFESFRAKVLHVFWAASDFLNEAI